MSKKLLMSRNERLAIAQWISDEKKTAINEQYKNNVAQLCASVAMYKLCNGDVRIWNSPKGELAYCKVLAVAVGAGMASVSWKE